MFMLHCSLVIRIICRKQHNNRALFVNVSKRLQQQPELRPDFLTPIPFAVQKAHVVCGSYFHYGQSFFCHSLQPRREQGAGEAPLSWKHRVAGMVCSTGGDHLWCNADLRLPIVAIFEYLTVPSKQICYRNNLGGNRRAVWEIILFHRNVVRSTNAQFHIPQAPPPLLSNHAGIRITCTLKLSSLVPKRPRGGTTTAVYTIAMPCSHLHCWINGVQSLKESWRAAWTLRFLRSLCLLKWYRAVKRMCVWGKKAYPLSSGSPFPRDGPRQYSAG